MVANASWTLLPYLKARIISYTRFNITLEQLFGARCNMKRWGAEQDITILACEDYATLREKCPNTELFLVRILLYSVRIQENADEK